MENSKENMHLHIRAERFKMASVQNRKHLLYLNSKEDILSPEVHQNNVFHSLVRIVQPEYRQCKLA